MAGRGGDFSFFWGIHVRINIRIDISISIGPMIPNFFFPETNEAGAGDAITSRSRDKLKSLYLHYQCLWPPNFAGW